MLLHFVFIVKNVGMFFYLNHNTKYIHATFCGFGREYILEHKLLNSKAPRKWRAFTQMSRKVN